MARIIDRERRSTHGSITFPKPYEVVADVNVADRPAAALDC
jgi:hypothetical protein